MNQLVTIDGAGKGTGVSFTEEDIQVIKDAVLPREASNAELKLFLAQCKRTGLDPLSRQIYAFMSKGKLTIGTSIDGARVIAERSGKYAGQVGPYWCGEDGVWKDVWLSPSPPLAARVGILRTDFKEPMWGIATFEGYKQQYYDRERQCWKLSGQWEKNSPNQMAKCAEALAMRKTFPNDLSGLYAEEELGQEKKQVETSTTSTSSQVVDAEETRPAPTIPAKGNSKSSRYKSPASIVIPPTAGRCLSVPFAQAIVEATTEVKKEVKAEVVNVETGEVTSIERGSPANELVSEADLEALGDIAVAHGFSEEEASEYIRKAFNVDENNILLKMTKAQLREANDYFVIGRK